MNMYQRPEISTLLSRMNKPDGPMTIISGPRQTGKTTLVREALSQTDRPSRYLSADEPESAEFPCPLSGTSRDARWLVGNWEIARRQANRSKRGFVVVFDEIQKIPDWSRTVKGLWDADRRFECPLHVVLLISVPFVKQKNTRKEAMTGRFFTINLTHWSFREMSEAFGFDLPSYIYFGGCPGAVPFIREHDKWRGYILDSLIRQVIGRDIPMIGNVNRPRLPEKLLNLCAMHSGTVFPYNGMLGHLKDACGEKTMKRYLELLSATGLVRCLPMYSERIFGHGPRSPKVNVLNTAIMSACCGYKPEEARADRTFWASLVESAVGAHLINSDRLWSHCYYWSNKGQDVSFVLRNARGSVAFQVRNRTRWADVNGLERFERRFSPLRSVIIGDGGMPLEEFLSVPASGWF